MFPWALTYSDCYFLFSDLPTSSFLATSVATSYNSPSEITFPKVISNTGDDYNSTSGVFTVRLSGIYFFSVSLVKTGHSKTPTSNSPTHIQCFLVMHDTAKLRMHVDTADTNGSDRGYFAVTNSGTFYLWKGTKVNVACGNGVDYIYSSNGCSFTGFLIHGDKV